MPLLLLFLFSFLGNSNRAELPFRLRSEGQFQFRRETLQSNVGYYVDQNFENNYNTRAKVSQARTAAAFIHAQPICLACEQTEQGCRCGLRVGLPSLTRICKTNSTRVWISVPTDFEGRERGGQILSQPSHEQMQTAENGATTDQARSKVNTYCGSQLRDCACMPVCTVNCASEPVLADRILMPTQMVQGTRKEKSSEQG